MKKKLFGLFLLSISIIVALGLVIILTNPSKDQGFIAQYQLEGQDTFRLNAKDSSFKIYTWDKDYVELHGSKFFSAVQETHAYDITYENQELTIKRPKKKRILTFILTSWITTNTLPRYESGSPDQMINFVDFIIFVPEGITTQYIGESYRHTDSSTRRDSY